MYMLNFCGGRSREGDIGSWAEADGVKCDTFDRKRGHELCSPHYVHRLTTRGGEYTSGHMSIPCFSYSPALSLPPGGADSGRAPVGPYRSEAHPNGVPGLAPDVVLRVDESTSLKRTMLSVAYAIHDSGGSVSIESSPDCRVKGQPGYLAFGGFSTATQFPLWADPEVAAYIAYTGSVIVNVPGCAAGSPYYNLKAWCLNPAANAFSDELRALRCPGVSDTHTHRRMTGIADDGRSHGEHAEEYPAKQGYIIYNMHRRAYDARTTPTPPRRPAMPPPPPRAPKPPPPPPPAPDPPASERPPQRTTCGVSPAAAHGGSSFSQAGRVARGAVASRVILVLVMAASLAVGLLPDGQAAQRAMRVAATAAGRHAVMETSASMLTEYGTNAVLAPLLMAGSVDTAAEITYVVAAVADDAYSGDVVPYKDIATTEMREYIALAVSAVEQMLGRPYAPAVPLPDGFTLGAAPPEAVAGEPPATDDGTRLFETRNKHDAEHVDALRPV